MSTFNGNRDSGCPCRGCSARTIGCHGKCEAYISWLPKVKERIKAEQDERAINDTMNDRMRREVWRWMRYSRQNRRNKP